MQNRLITSTIATVILAAAVAQGQPQPPIIHDLPNVIIGDAGTAARAVRNAVPDAISERVQPRESTVIERRNEYEDAKFHVFYSEDPAQVPQVKPSGKPGGSIIDSDSARGRRPSSTEWRRPPSRKISLTERPAISGCRC